jgi:peptidoglycan/xylan/chitin deacetylase (PgdA/CDA1 family)
MRGLVSKFQVLLGALVVLTVSAFTAPAIAANGAVVFMYHRFGENDWPTTSIRLEQFKAHLQEIARGGYTVLPIPEIIDALQNGRALPDRTIGLSIDDAYRSVYEKAWPLLEAAKLPFTLFVSTDVIDSGSNNYMSWAQIRELKDKGVTIGNQTKSHPHLVELSLEQVGRELRASNARLADEMDEMPTFLAYPFGEYSLQIKEIASDLGFTAAFGQQSGVMHAAADMFALPRFTMNETYGGIDRFRLAANALPLPVTDVLPADPVLATNPPAFGFTVQPDLAGLAQLACFASGQGRAKLQRLDNRVEVRVLEPFPPGRSRINCTMPGPDRRWRWYGMQFYVPR